MSDKIEKAAEESLEYIFNNNSAKLSMLNGRWVTVDFATKTALEHTKNAIADLKQKNAGLVYNAYCRLEENQQLQSTITTLQAENSRLKGSLNEILHHTNHRTVSTIPACNRIATEALTPKE